MNRQLDAEPANARQWAFEATGVSKSFGRATVLKNVTLALRPGEVVAVMGANGAGKSTLMNIIAGALRPDAGVTRVQGRDVTLRTPAEAHSVGIVMVHQELHLVPELSVAENIMLGQQVGLNGVVVSQDAIRQAASQVLVRLGSDLDPARRVSTLRVAEQQIVELAKAMSRRARVLILDEPTAALSEQDAKRLLTVLRTLREQGVAILYISHRMDEVFQIADRLFVMRDGEVCLFEEASKVTPEQVVKAMVGDEAARGQSRYSEPGKDIVLSVERLHRARGHGGVGLSDLSLDVRRGEIVGLAGLTGAGRTELLEVIAGACPANWSGRISLGGVEYKPRKPRDGINEGVAYVTEDRKQTGLLLQESILQNVALASLPRMSRGGWMKGAAMRAQAAAAIAKLGIAATSPDQQVSLLSGGNQQKVVIAKWLATTPRLLLLDEPTRGVDIGAKTAMYDLLKTLAGEGLSIIVASSEWSELMALSHRILALQDGRLAGQLFPRDYSEEALQRLVTPMRLGGLAADVREVA